MTRLVAARFEKTIRFRRKDEKVVTKSELKPECLYGFSYVLPFLFVPAKKEKKPTSASSRRLSLTCTGVYESIQDDPMLSFLLLPF